MSWKICYICAYSLFAYKIFCFGLILIIEMRALEPEYAISMRQYNWAVVDNINYVYEVHILYKNENITIGSELTSRIIVLLH